MSTPNSVKMLWPFGPSSASEVPVCSMRPRLLERLVYGDCLSEQTTLSQRFGPDVPLRLHRYSPGRWGVLRGLLCAGVQRDDAALYRQKRDITIPRVWSGKSSIVEVLYLPLHLEHVGGQEPFQPVAFDGMSGIPLLMQYRSVRGGGVNGAHVPDDLQIYLMAVAGVNVDLDVGESASAQL